MADRVQFDLVAPERLLRSLAADMIVVPGVEGDFGVLPGHAPVVSTLRPGVVEVHTAESDVERIFVAGGVCEVSSDCCMVLADSAVPLAELNRDDIEQRLKDAKEDLADASTDVQQHKAADAVALLTELLGAAR